MSKTQSDGSSAYREAGVNIDAQDEALGQIKQMVRGTFTGGVLSDVGSFGGLFRPDLAGMKEPVLVASADGVGTKLAVARMAGDFTTVGGDLVNHCVNDILVQGAVPLFFLDYIGTGVLEPQSVVDLVDGVAAACRYNGCALLGGELAEMPGFYQPGDHELVGFIVGMVDRHRVFDGARVRPKDVLVGLPSAGLHTNGYSLARRVVFDQLGLALDDRLPNSEGRETVQDHLLAPHVSYLPAIKPLLDHPALHAMAHITGGGLTDNLPRVLGQGNHALIRVGSWAIPELFTLLQTHGGVDDDEMFRVFNMGIGMVLAVAPDGLADVLRLLREQGQKALPIGTVQAGDHGVAYDYGPDSDAS